MVSQFHNNDLPITTDKDAVSARPLPPNIATGLAKLALVFRHEAWRATGEHGLSPTQAQILSTISNSQAPLGIKDIAAKLALTVGTVSAAVTTLSGKGLLAKRKSDTDARAVVVELTSNGNEHLQANNEWPAPLLAALGALSSKDKAGLNRGLIALIRELQQQGAVPTACMCVECEHFRPHDYPGHHKPHHCTLINQPIADTDLRIECPEMKPLAAPDRDRVWQLFVEGSPLPKRADDPS